ncbi:MAG: hypothetical protein KC668_14245 [Myxococcales bacterium]|nr:hypothetical protein [Myxococcales bacterium]
MHDATRSISALIAASLLACSARAPTTADPRRLANGTEALDGLAQRLSAAPLVDRPAGFALLTTTGDLLFVDERGEVTHRAPAAATQLADCGAAICVTNDDSVRWLSWPDGGMRGSLARSPAATLIGGALEGARAVLVESEGPRRGRIVLARTTDAGLEVTRALPADGELGAPLLRGGVLLVPHDGHELLLLDAANGAELARRRSGDDTIRWTRIDGGDVFYGGERVYALQPGVATQQRVDAVLDPDTALVPAPPFRARIEPDTWSVVVPAADEPALPAPVHFARTPLSPSPTPRSDRSYVVTRGHVFAFDGDGTLRFAHALRDAPVATLATPDGLVLLHADGVLLGLHPDDGSARYERRLPPVRAAIAVRAVGRRTRAVPALDSAGAEQDLLRVLHVRDARFVGDQVYAAHLLVDAGVSVARALLDAYEDPRTEPPVRDAIAMTLRARRDDTDSLVDALNQHYDFLADDGPRPPPPLEVILPALAGADRHDAYGALLPHLNDPATPPAALPALITQLVRWGGPDALPSLLAFVERYRADAEFREDPRALVVATLAIDALGDVTMRDRLERYVTEAGAHPELRAALLDARAHRATELATHDAPAQDTRPAPRPDQTTTGEAPAARTASAADVQAYALAQLAQLTPCLNAAQAADPTLRTVRVRMVLEREEHVGLVSVLPGGALERCLADVLVTLRWPRIRVRRQQVGFTLHVAPEREPPLPAGWLWWQRAASRAQRDASVQPGLPWWDSGGEARSGAEGDDTWWRTPDDDDASPLDRWWLPSADGR